ncbi:MAG: SemiSWEET family transporter [Alphaproteobacteria bacterium]|nr:SemiSWEET family transporter [Alphaproteobacteria bacterium]
MNFIENFFGTIALVTSIIGLLPQIYKSFKTKSTNDISMIMLLNYLICSISWIIYGTYTKSDFVIWSNIIGLITSLIAIFQKRYYDKQ